MEIAIETSSLSKRFGDKLALEDCNLFVPRGAVYGFLGANGAGKSTAIRLLLGLLEPDEGTISFFGRQVSRGERPYIGAVSDARGQALYDHLTARQNLEITLTLVGRSKREADELLALVEMTDHANSKVSGFSTGMRQRLAIARALVANPNIVILDEPLNGLDPAGIRAFRQLIQRLSSEKGMTLIICSHLLDEVQKVASHVGLLHGGRLVAQGAIDDVLGSQNSLAIEIEGRESREAEKILSPFGMVKFSDRAFEIEGCAHQSAAIAEELISKGIRLTRLNPKFPTLENLYHDLIGKAA